MKSISNQRSLYFLTVWLGLWLASVFMGFWLLEQASSLIGARITASGHSHVFAHGHQFADARGWVTPWVTIPNALDVLSNLPFFLLGVFGLRQLQRHRADAAFKTPAQVFFAGLIATSVFSSVYHLAPAQSLGLALDRMGMAIAFAGVIGMALYERTAIRNISMPMCLVLGVGVVSAFVPYLGGSVLPWGVVQFGGLVFVTLCAFAQPSSRALGLNFVALIACYGIAKCLELNDALIFNTTQAALSGVGLAGVGLSGHSLKHIAASCAALPVIFAVSRQTKVHQ